MARKVKKLNLIEGGDTLIGTAQADQFVLREGQGNIVVEGFEPGSDKVLFDFNSYSDVLGWGRLSDGQVITDFTGLTNILVSATDLNADGITDTMFSVGSDSITLLGVSPDRLYSGSLMGG